MNNLTTYTLSALLFFAAISSGHAATVVCSGTIQELAYHQPGRLIIKLSSMNTGVTFCSSDNDWKVAGSLVDGPTTPTSCMLLYSTFLSIKASGTSIKSMYFDGDAVPANCASFKDWGAANLRYFNL